jgi:hypothetical protein
MVVVRVPTVDSNGGYMLQLGVVGWASAVVPTTVGSWHVSHVTAAVCNSA